MSKITTTKASKTDWQALATMKDEDIDFSELPEVTEEQMARAQLRFGGQLVPRGKVRVNLLLDAGVVAFFKAQAGGRAFQTLINEALKEKIRAQDLETVVRNAIRKELQAAVK